MYTSYLRACLFLIGFILSLSVNAAGLGKLTVNSFLGQPLNAEIDLFLVSVSDDELSSLKADFASREAFAQAGIRYKPFFSTFKVSIESRVNGEPYVQITSPQAVNEPFLNMLVELSWASGRLLREYTILLDPAESKRSELVSPVVPAISDEDVSTETAAAQLEAPEKKAASVGQVMGTSDLDPAASVAQQSSPGVDPSGTYGPVLKGDNLSSIAHQVRPDEISINRMLVALYRTNREAFIADNMNLLRTGVVLKIPPLQELNQITEKEALAEIRIQTGDWHQYRQKLAESTQESPSQEAKKQMDSGRITTTVDHDHPIQSESPQEVLRLSGGGNSTDAENTELNTLQQLRMMEEDVIARDLALEEANERVAMLEKNIENLQKLLTLQNSELAQAQAQANAQASESFQTENESIEVISSESVPAAESASESDIVSEDNAMVEVDVFSESEETVPASETTAEGVDETGPMSDIDQVASTSLTSSGITDTRTVDETVTSPIQPIDSEEASLLDPMMDNITYIAAGSAIAVLLTIALMIRQRKKAEEEAAIEEAKNKELSSALRNKAAAVVAAAHADNRDQASVDDFDKSAQFFSDEDVHDNEQSPNKRDFLSDPDDQAKIFKQKSFVKANETGAPAFSEEMDKAETQFVNQLEEADSINNTIDDAKTDFEDFNDFPSALPSDTADNTKSAEQKPSQDQQEEKELANFTAFNNKAGTEVTEEEKTKDDEHLIDFLENESAESGRADDDELRIDIDDSSESQQSDTSKGELADAVSNVGSASKFESEAKTVTDNTINFSVDPATIDLSDEDMLNNETEYSKDSLNSEHSMPDLPDSNLESETDLVSSELQAERNDDFNDDSSAQNSAVDFSDINLEIEGPAETSGDKNQANVEESAPQFTDTNLKDGQRHEVSTKIDLAKAYLEMEDSESAREMLEEVIRKGDAEQQKDAQELLDKL